MKPTITFDKNAVKYILNFLGKSIDEDNYILDVDREKKSNLQFKRSKCGICKKPIRINHFAGIVKNVGLVCDNICCLISIPIKNVKK